MGQSNLEHRLVTSNSNHIPNLKMYSFSSPDAKVNGISEKWLPVCSVATTACKQIPLMLSCLSCIRWFYFAELTCL